MNFDHSILTILLLTPLLGAGGEGPPGEPSLCCWRSGPLTDPAGDGAVRLADAGGPSVSCRRERRFGRCSSREAR